MLHSNKKMGNNKGLISWIFLSTVTFTALILSINYVGNLLNMGSELTQFNQLVDISLLKLQSSSRGNGGAGGGGGGNRLNYYDEDEGDRRRRGRWEREGWGREWDYFFGNGGNNGNGGNDGNDGRSSGEGQQSSSDNSYPPGSGARPKVGPSGTSPRSSLRRRPGDGSYQPYGHFGGRDVDPATLQRNVDTLRKNYEKKHGGVETDSAPSTSSGFDEDKVGRIFLDLLGDPEVLDLYKLFLQTAPKDQHQSLEDIIVKSGFDKHKVFVMLTRFVQ